jgi:hypothetical protein
VSSIVLQGVDVFLSEIPCHSEFRAVLHPKSETRIGRENE